MKINLLTEVAAGYGVLSRGEHDLPEARAEEFLRLGWAELPDAPELPQKQETQHTPPKRRK